MNFTSNPKFQLGKLVATPGSLEVLKKSNQSPTDFLTLHQSGQWGEDLCPEDKKLNDEAVAYEGDTDKQQRVLSSYKTKTDERIWIITEWDRSATTILLPDEY